MTDLDLQGIEHEFLRECTPCDFGGSGVCTCPRRPYHPVMRALINEVERLRAQVTGDAPNADAGAAPSTARFGVAVDSSNGAHVRFRVFAATGGAHLGGCGALVMRTAEYAAFRALLEPALTDRPDLAEENCSYRDDPGHDHAQCLEQHAAEIEGTGTRG